jgi:hypothetical protein
MNADRSGWRDGSVQLVAEGFFGEQPLRTRCVALPAAVPKQRQSGLVASGVFNPHGEVAPV